MRTTKTSKNNTTKITATLSGSQPKENTSSQTPIEIALKIDENGMTSLRNLYEFLELDKSHYKRWYTQNILKNSFAAENIDYFIVSLDGDPKKYNPNPTLEFKLTTDFAKQLSMTVKNERGQEARKYFIACEQGLKVATQRLQSNPNNEINEKLIELLTSMDNRLSKLEEQSNKNKLPENKYSRWKRNVFDKLGILTNYMKCNIDNISGKPIDLPYVMHLVIRETEDIYNIDINEYSDMYRFEFCIDSEVKVQVLDVINHYKDIRDMFTLTLDSIMKKLHIAEDTNGNKTKNIFDELAAKIENNLEN